MMTAKPDAPMEASTLFMKRLTNSSRTVEVCQMVSGDRPSERHPFQSGWKSKNGMRWPCITSGAILKLVVTVQ